MGIELRGARSEDKPRILEISSQIWEGNDYVPFIVDDWLSDAGGEFVEALRPLLADRATRRVIPRRERPAGRSSLAALFAGVQDKHERDERIHRGSAATSTR